MIVRTYRTCCFVEYNQSHFKVFEQDPIFSGPSGIFDWRLLSSLGTGSLFVGLNYDGNAVSFIRQNCVYTAYHASLHAPYLDMCRHALQPKVGERSQVSDFDLLAGVSPVRHPSGSSLSQSP